MAILTVARMISKCLEPLREKPKDKTRTQDPENGPMHINDAMGPAAVCANTPYCLQEQATVRYINTYRTTPSPNFEKHILY